MVDVNVEVDGLSEEQLDALIKKAEKQKLANRKGDVDNLATSLKEQADSLAIAIDEGIKKYNLSSAEVATLSSSAFTKLNKALEKEGSVTESKASASGYKGVLGKFADAEYLVLDLGEKRMFITKSTKGVLKDFYKNLLKEQLDQDFENRTEVLLHFYPNMNDDSGKVEFDNLSTVTGDEAIQLLKDGVEHPDREKVMKQAVKLDL